MDRVLPDIVTVAPVPEPCPLRDPLAATRDVGVIALATDSVGAADLAAFLGGDADLHATRVAVDAVLTPDNLAAMGPRLEAAAALLLPGRPLAAVVYSCTSGTIAIGQDGVRDAVRRGRGEVEVITPVGAVLGALARRDAGRVSMLMPYRADTAAMVAGHFEDQGLALDRVTTLGLEGDIEINALAPEALIAAAGQACHPDSEALFVSCTGLATHGLIPALQAAAGRPVVTSNGALAEAVRPHLGTR